MKIIGSTAEHDGVGSVRVEDHFATDVDDLWAACTAPDRLARWIGEVSGDLRVGGEFRARFSSGWEGTGRIETCDAPHRLTVVTREADATADTVVELTLTAAGAGSTLVIEERGLPIDQLPAYGAGWQAHVEDLAAHLTGAKRCDVPTRWRELHPHYLRASAG